jgi:RNA polymerase sigma-70 factor (ECF subfamily)
VSRYPGSRTSSPAVGWTSAAAATTIVSNALGIARMSGAGLRGPVLDDQALARRVAAGEPGVERAIWDHYSPGVRRFMRRAFGPDFDAQDLTQDTFLEVFARLGKLRQPEALRAFVYTVATNVVRMELRRRKVRRIIRLTDGGQLPEVRTTAAEPDVMAAARRLYAHLDRLRVSERECFVLRHLEGMELLEVAEATGLSLATVKRRLDHASTKLMALVSEDAILTTFVDRNQRQGGES